MPRTIFDKRPEKLSILLNGASANISRDELGDIIGKGAQTAGYRMRDPNTLTIGELRSIGRKLHIPIDDLRQAIEY